MKDQEDLVCVYTGTIVEGNFLKGILEERGIGALLRNTLQESMVAGWASGAPDDSALIFVAAEDVPEAKKIIGEYFEEIK
jgi:hypothetical protein